MRQGTYYLRAAQSTALDQVGRDKADVFRVKFALMNAIGTPTHWPTRRCFKRTSNRS